MASPWPLESGRLHWAALVDNLIGKLETVLEVVTSIKVRPLAG